MSNDFGALKGTVEFSSEITISLSFTAKCVDWNALKLCALGDLRGDKTLNF